ncbi:hypothetical protein PTSG_12952 [Salpingoeca rosetta]|uniref:Uncharacterized protein n=1 Tax=Salpingoeca rosetta (strain ATCC 50818 / BSB-021) TaxID=946362 RepID=F2UNH9_SALR5|nr:uncharacterized protein PTSG_12952 [Salpingoeca rosetta]EGD79184.1 hypothetical protein PTSG_12952 [Salpingoeca rosetta]|eukprot:XP_004989269.1 hypothetical protein PTSG_12952 [Salpingoeca rosetta]
MCACACFAPPIEQRFYARCDVSARACTVSFLPLFSLLFFSPLLARLLLSALKQARRVSVVYVFSLHRGTRQARHSLNLLQCCCLVCVHCPFVWMCALRVTFPTHTSSNHVTSVESAFGGTRRKHSARVRSRLSRTHACLCLCLCG